MSKINPNKASKLSTTAIPKPDILSDHYTTLKTTHRKNARIVKSFAMREVDIKRLKKINKNMQDSQHKNVTASDVIKTLLILAEKTETDSLIKCFQQSLLE